MKLNQVHYFPNAYFMPENLAMLKIQSEGHVKVSGI
jgi:hypothetical protein